MKYSYFIGVFLLISVSAQAETLCHSSVSYVWKKLQAEASAEVFWTRLERKGADEATAKRVLDTALSEERSRAFDACKKEHENLAGCVSAKFGSLESTMPRLSFSQKKSLEEAVNTDCSSRQGSCVEVKVTDPVCAELVTASSSSSAPAAAAGKDAKKKK